MNKKERSLTWKYFWQQKWEEIRPVLYFLLGFVGFVLICYMGISAEKGNWQWIVWTIFQILTGLLLISLLVFIIYLWLGNNWKKAKKKAKRELKKK